MNKERFIKLELNDYFNQFRKLLPQELDFIFDDLYIAGGSIASLVQKETPEDIDLYFKTNSVRNRYVAEISKIIQNPPSLRVHMTLNCHEFQLKDGMKIQLVLTFSGAPREVITNFDFGHCQSFYDPNTEELYLPDGVMMLCENRHLLVNDKASYPLRALERVIKFLSRRYTIAPKEILKLALQINSLDLTDPTELEKQISGMYVSKRSKNEFKKLAAEIKHKKFNNRFSNLLKSEDDELTGVSK